MTSCKRWSLWQNLFTACRQLLLPKPGRRPTVAPIKRCVRQDLGSINTVDAIPYRRVLVVVESLDLHQLLVLLLVKVAHVVTDVLLLERAQRQRAGAGLHSSIGGSHSALLMVTSQCIEPQNAPCRRTGGTFYQPHRTWPPRSRLAPAPRAAQL